MNTRMAISAAFGVALILAGCADQHGSSPDSSTSQRSVVTNVDPAQYRNGIGGDVAFVSPTKNIWCRLGAARTTATTAGCQAKDAPVPAGAEKSCAGNEMYPPSSLSRGFRFDGDAVVATCFNQGIFTSPNPTALPYGSSISANGYTCTSRESGITCTNRQGHGFVLSRQQARQF